MRARRLHHITQLEYQRTRAWWVRLYRSFPRRARAPSGTGPRPRPKRELAAQKSFPYARYGSKAKALEAAIQWRDAQLPKHDAPPSRPYAKGAKRPAGTGYIKRGWRTRVHKRTGKRTRYEVWHAWIRLRDGKSASSHYSIEKWGDEGAHLLIRSWFAQKVRQCKRKR